MSCDVGAHIGFSFTREHRQNGEGQREVCSKDNEGVVQDLGEGIFHQGIQIRGFASDSHIFPGKTGKYLYYRPAAWRTLMVESVNLL